RVGSERRADLRSIDDEADALHEFSGTAGRRDHGDSIADGHWIVPAGKDRGVEGRREDLSDLLQRTRDDWTRHRRVFKELCRRSEESGTAGVGDMRRQ